MTRSIKFFLASLLTLMVPASGAMAGQTLYSNTYFNKQVPALSIGADGTLTPLSGSPFEVGFLAEGLAFSPDARTLVIASAFEKKLETRAIGADGAVPATGPETAEPVMTSPTVSPDGRFVYIGSQAGGVLSFSLASDGSLSKLGGGAAGKALVFAPPNETPDGRFLYLASGLAGEIEGFSIQSDGTPAALPGEPTGVSGGPLRGLRITPDGRYAIALNVGAKAWIRAYAIGADGSLAEVPSSKVELADGSVGGLVVSPNGRFAYLGDVNEKNIHGFAIGADGRLSEAGAPTKAEVDSPEGMAISDDGRFLFVQPENGALIQAFAIAADGTLTKAGGNVTTDKGSDHTFPIPRPAVPKGALRAGTAAPGKEVAFDASGSSDLGASITGYSWAFGDGKVETTTSPATRHAYKKAGVYAASVTVLDDAGCTGFIYTGQSAYCNGREASASAKVDTLPAIAKLKAKRKKGKVVFGYRLEEKAKVTFTVQRKKGKKLRVLGTFSKEGKPGANKAKLPKKLKGKRLKPGSYVVSAAATDSAGGSSAPAKAKFKLKPAG